MYKDYPSQVEAQQGLVASGIVGMRVELAPMLGDRVQPVVVCDFESDLVEVQKRGFNARLVNDYAYDG